MTFYRDPEMGSTKPLAHLPLFDSPRAAARRNGPDTSKAAAKAFTEQRLTEIQSAVLELFRIRGRLTDEEIEDELFVRYPAFSTLRKRRTNLVQMGLICDSGERKRNRNRRRMIVWEIVKEEK